MSRLIFVVFFHCVLPRNIAHSELTLKSHIKMESSQAIEISIKKK